MIKKHKNNTKSMILTGVSAASLPLLPDNRLRKSGTAA
jgi:hypothetical protein